MLTIGQLAAYVGVTVRAVRHYHQVGLLPEPERDASGYRSDGTALGWLGVVGLVLLMTFALTWLTVALGLSAPNAETASNSPMPLMFLPFLSSGFVPTDSMPAGLQWFAEYQPFTPFIETIRALLLGTPLGANLWLAIGWCAVLIVGGYIWSMVLYERKSVR